eukprot:15573143-Heterocapsa_arctica.AAC.1
MLYESDFDQCTYNLQLPPFDAHTFCNKSTRIWATFPDILVLNRKCPGLSEKHRHVHAQGSVKFEGKTVSLATAAG